MEGLCVAELSLVECVVRRLAGPEEGRRGGLAAGQKVGLVAGQRVAWGDVRLAVLEVAWVAVQIGVARGRTELSRVVHQSSGLREGSRKGSSPRMGTGEVHLEVVQEV